MSVSRLTIEVDQTVLEVDQASFEALIEYQSNRIEFPTSTAFRSVEYKLISSS